VKRWSPGLGDDHRQQLAVDQRLQTLTLSRRERAEARLVVEVCGQVAEQQPDTRGGGAAGC